MIKNSSKGIRDGFPVDNNKGLGLRRGPHRPRAKIVVTKVTSKRSNFT